MIAIERNMVNPGMLAHLLLVLSIVFCSAASAKAKDLLSEQERAWLAEHPVIRLAPDPDFPPIEYLDESGGYRGLAADYVKLLEQKLAMQISIVALPSWDDVLQQAKIRAVDMLGAATSTPQREEYMRFSAPHIELPGVILVRSQQSGDRTLEQLHGRRVAVVSGYVWQELIARDHPEITIVPVPDLLSGLHQVSFGTVDAMVANLATATHYIEKSGITNLRVAGKSGYFGRYAFAVRNDWPELSAILSKGLNAISKEERAAIFDKWIGLHTATRWSNPMLKWYLSSGIGAFILFAVIAWIWSLRRLVSIRTTELSNELTHRQNAEWAKRRSEQRYSTLFNSASDAIFVMSGEYFIDCNPAACELFACTREQLIGQPPYRFSTVQQRDGSDSQQKSLQLIKEALSGTPLISEWQHTRYDGSPFDAEVSLTAYTEGDSRFILAVVRNITERKRIDRMKDEFISTVSHEIRTPLTSIRGSLGLIAGGVVQDSPEKLSELVQIAYSNTERLLNLVNDLLDTQKLQSGKIVFHRVAVDVNRFLSSAIKGSHTFSEQLHVTLQFTAMKDSFTILADTDRLLQVMTNLLSNAIKFSPQGQTVEIAATKQGEKLRISVSDRGPGIAEEFHSRIFERFSQADGSATRRVGGTGLGLSIAKAIVEGHGGEIDFENRSGGGVIFFFDLPIVPPSSGS